MFERTELYCVERWAKRIRLRPIIFDGLVCHFTGFKENVGLGVRLLCYTVSAVVFHWNGTVGWSWKENWC